MGALVAVPLGPWVEFRRKRPVMVAMDLTRFAALHERPRSRSRSAGSRFAQLLVVSVVVAAADIAFKAASGAYLKALVRPEDLLVANGRFESTTWTATALGPPLGGAAIGLFGPVTTVVANAVSYLLSAAGIRAIGGGEPRPERTGARGCGRATCSRAGATSWATPALRPLFFNTVLVNGLIMATAPLLAVLMLGDLGFAPWQYGLAFGAPVRRRPRRLAARAPARRAVRTAPGHAHRRDAARVLVGRPGLRRPGVAGLVARHRRRSSAWSPAWASSTRCSPPTGSTSTADRPGRPHAAAWSITQQRHHRGHDRRCGACSPPLTGPRTAIAVAGLLMLATPLLLPRRERGLAAVLTPVSAQASDGRYH